MDLAEIIHAESKEQASLRLLEEVRTWQPHGEHRPLLDAVQGLSIDGLQALVTASFKANDILQEYEDSPETNRLKAYVAYDRGLLYEELAKRTEGEERKNHWVNSSKAHNDSFEFSAYSHKMHASKALWRRSLMQHTVAEHALREGRKNGFSKWATRAYNALLLSAEISGEIAENTQKPNQEEYAARVRIESLHGAAKLANQISIYSPNASNRRVMRAEAGKLWEQALEEAPEIARDMMGTIHHKLGSLYFNWLTQKNRIPRLQDAIFHFTEALSYADKDSTVAVIRGKRGEVENSLGRMINDSELLAAAIVDYAAYITHYQNSEIPRVKGLITKFSRAIDNIKEKYQQ